MDPLMERERARITTQHDQLCSWLCDAAYPLWSTRGVDPAGGFHERLAQTGEPVIEPSCVNCTGAVSGETGLARPKSNNLATSCMPPRCAEKILPGLISR